MFEIEKLDEDIGFGDQPTVADLRGMRALGVRTVVNVRLPAEQPKPERPDVERVGLRYVQIPVAQGEWSEDAFDALEAALAERDALPALVHCDSGGRSGILALAWHAKRRGWTEDHLIARARTLGVELPDAALRWLRRGAEARV